MSRRDIHVGAEEADAHRAADPVLGAGYRGFPPGAAVVGGPEQAGGRSPNWPRRATPKCWSATSPRTRPTCLASYRRLAAVRAALAAPTRTNE